MENIVNKLTELGYRLQEKRFYVNIYEKEIEIFYNNPNDIKYKIGSGGLYIRIQLDRNNKINYYEVSDVNDSNPYSENTFTNIEELEKEYNIFKKLFEILKEDLKELNYYD